MQQQNNQSGIYKLIIENIEKSTNKKFEEYNEKLKLEANLYYYDKLKVVESLAKSGYLDRFIKLPNHQEILNLISNNIKLRNINIFNLNKIIELYNCCLNENDKELFTNLLKIADNQAELDVITFILNDKIKSLLKEKPELIKSFGKIIEEFKEDSWKTTILINRLNNYLSKNYFDSIINNISLNYKSIYKLTSIFENELEALDEKNRYYSIISFGRIDKEVVNIKSIVDYIKNMGYSLEIILQNLHYLVTVKDIEKIDSAFYKELKESFKNEQTFKSILNKYENYTIRYPYERD